MARRGKGKRSKKRVQLDLEAIGLVLLAGGIFLLGVVLPGLPTGQVGRAVRAALAGRFGWGAYALPVPLLALGGLFLLRRSPRWWPRLLAGYLLFAAGAWGVVVVLAAPHTGRYGLALRASLTGAWGALAIIPALFVASVGWDLLLGLTPTRLTRSLLLTLVKSVRGEGRGLWQARRRAKERAAFRADVALARRALQELDRDLQALSTLYPGSAELDRWRAEVKASVRRLSGRPDGEQLADARADLKAWQSAVKDFARDRASEMVELLKAEGAHAPQDAADGFGETLDGWARRLKATLDDPVSGRTPTARALDRLRKTLALDLTGLLERYRRVTRERDLDQRALKGMSPRQLARASADHGRRLQDYVRLETDAARLDADAAALEPWRDLALRLQQVQEAYPDAAEVDDFDETLAAELDQKGTATLARFEGWREALEAVAGRAEAAARREREAVAVGAAVGAAGASGAGLVEPEGDGAAEVDRPPWLAPDDEDPFLADGAVPAAAPPVDGRDPELEAALLDDGVVAGSAGTAGDDEGPASETSEEVPEYGGIPIQVPPLTLLDEPEAAVEDRAELAREHRERVRKIDDTLSSFNLQGRVVAAVRGPTVTRFEVEPAPGEKIARFANLSDDLALAMAVGSVRIEAPIPGKSVIGLEVPNANRELVRFREAAESGSFRRAKARLPILLGKSIDGDMVVGDLA
ncbi:MAG: DNA translocase FtsK, partial [Deinococcales bacterium]